MAEAAMSNTGHSSAESSTFVVQLITRWSVVEGKGKVAVVTVLPATSCAQVTTAPGVTSNVLLMILRSRLSRGRSISRCGPSCTGSRYR